MVPSTLMASIIMKAAECRGATADSLRISSKGLVVT